MPHSRSIAAHYRPPLPSTLPGAISFWPTIVYAPIEMYIASQAPPRAARLGLQAINLSIALLALGALLGSVYEFAHAAASFRPFSV